MERLDFFAYFFCQEKSKAPPARRAMKQFSERYRQKVATLAKADLARNQDSFRMTKEYKDAAATPLQTGLMHSHKLRSR